MVFIVVRVLYRAIEITIILVTTITITPMTYEYEFNVRDYRPPPRLPPFGSAYTFFSWRIVFDDTDAAVAELSLNC